MAWTRQMCSPSSNAHTDGAYEDLRAGVGQSLRPVDRLDPAEGTAHDANETAVAMTQLRCSLIDLDIEVETWPLHWIVIEAIKIKGAREWWLVDLGAT